MARFLRGHCKTYDSDISAKPRSYHSALCRCFLVIFIPVLIPLLLNVSAGMPSARAYASDAKPEGVVVIPVHDIIDLGLAFFIKRSLHEAESMGAAAVILEMNTLGGRVDAALEIRDALEDCKLPITAYVDKRAISAGALICLATKDIAMAPGSTIGAATPISIGPMGEKGQLSEKEVSYVRGEFRATAERNGHSPLLAEAMVDPDVQVSAFFTEDGPVVVKSSDVDETRKKYKNAKVEVVSPEGKLLTMTASEAERFGLARSTPGSLEELVSSLGLDPENITRAGISWSERLVRFLTHPIVSGLLLTLGVLAIFFELQMPGWGISGTLGVAFLALFFCGHYLAGLASIADVLLFAVGIVLLALELFVVPGFGITGVSGLICILAAIYLALVKRAIPEFSWDYQRLNSVLYTMIIVFVASAVGIVIIWKRFPNSRFGKFMVLSESQYPEKGYISADSLEALIGESGTSITHLRPAGKAMIRQKPVEVQTQGEFIERNRPVKVVKVAGNKVFVAEEETGVS